MSENVNVDIELGMRQIRLILAIQYINPDGTTDPRIHDTVDVDVPEDVWWKIAPWSNEAQKGNAFAIIGGHVLPAEGGDK